MLNSEAVVEPTSASRGRIAPFGKYLLLQRVSVGGMAEVFKAIPADAQRIDQIVAIKRILPSIAEDSEFIGMFIDEARIAGQLTHPNICRMYELGRVGADHYIAMQFLWGRDLLKVMNRHKKAGRYVSPSMAAFVGARALSALHYAHTKCDARGRPLNVIHRDVSPQNIIVGYSGQVKLIDFGVARAASQSQKTQAGILKGKFGYMSPEMVRGLPIDHRSDVFAMGICLHELLTNARLFYGDTDFATLELVRDAQVVPPSLKAPEIPPELDAVVMKALSREAEDRYQTAEEMQRALEQFLASQDQPYGQTDVGMAMRQAFHTEVARERERLDIFWKMLDRGELVRGALVPASSAELASDSRLSPSGGQTPSGAQESEPLHEEQTHIFFSADELDEVTDLKHRGPPPTARPATLSDLIPPALPDQAGRPVHKYTSSGTYQRAASDSSSSEVPVESPSERGSTQPWTREQRVSMRGSGRIARYAVLALLLVTLGMATYAVPRFATAGTGALAIETVDDPDALVRVDGIVRGNPPLLVQELTPGVHKIEIEATGYEVARADVLVEQGQARRVKLTLEKADVVGAGPKPGSSPQITALPGQAPKPRRASEEQPTEKPAEQKSGEPTTPISALAATSESGEEVDALPPSREENAVGESVSAELAARNEGELLISTVPWSHVFVDGSDTKRDTPVRALRVTAGAHRVGLRTPDDQMHEFDVMVKPGQTVRIIRRF
jgi:serine/threonine protein kinase